MSTSKRTVTPARTLAHASMLVAAIGLTSSTACVRAQRPQPADYLLRRTLALVEEISGGARAVFENDNPGCISHMTTAQRMVSELPNVPGKIELHERVTRVLRNCLGQSKSEGSD